MTGDLANVISAVVSAVAAVVFAMLAQSGRTRQAWPGWRVPTVLWAMAALSATSSALRVVGPCWPWLVRVGPFWVAILAGLGLAWWGRRNTARLKAETARLRAANQAKARRMLGGSP